MTVRVRARECLFGEVIDGEMAPNQAGRIVQAVWDELPARFPGMMTDAFVAMPNHHHGIIVLGAIADEDETNPTKWARFIAPSSPTQPPIPVGSNLVSPPLGEVVRAFKAVSTRMIRQMELPRFTWQRNYYEHIVRDDRTLDRPRAYIDQNPERWTTDQLHPNVSSRW